jgi:hypothetical protein
MRTAACEWVGRSRPGGPGDALLTMAANLRIQIHFTPDLRVVAQPRRDLVRGIIERQVIHGRTFASVRELMIKIRTFINGWSDRCHRFIWTKTADQILKKANRQNNSSCGPQVMQKISRGDSRTVTDRLTASLTQRRSRQLKLFLLLREAGPSCCFQGGATQTAGAAPVLAVVILHRLRNRNIARRCCRFPR